MRSRRLHVLPQYSFTTARKDFSSLMARPLKYDDATRDKWIQMRLDGCTTDQIAEATNAVPRTVTAYFAAIGITRNGNYNEPEPDPPEDSLVWVDGYQLEPDAALRFLQLKAALGIGRSCYPVEDER